MELKYQKCWSKLIAKCPIKSVKQKKQVERDSCIVTEGNIFNWKNNRVITMASVLLVKSNEENSYVNAKHGTADTEHHHSLFE